MRQTLEDKGAVPLNIINTYVVVDGQKSLDIKDRGQLFEAGLALCFKLLEPDQGI
jgi:hypothetical protein